MRGLLRSTLRGVFRLMMAALLLPSHRNVLRLHADLARLRKDFDDACAELSALGAACDELRLQLEHLRLPRFPVTHLRPDKDGIWIGVRNAEERAALMRLFQIEPSCSPASRHQDVAKGEVRIALLARSG
jgi:hypothetical protein